MTSLIQKACCCGEEDSDYVEFKLPPPAALISHWVVNVIQTIPTNTGQQLMVAVRLIQEILNALRLVKQIVLRPDQTIVLLAVLSTWIRKNS